MEKLWKELDKLAEATGIAVEQLYEILTQQAKVKLVYDVLGVIGVIVVIVIGIMLSKYFFRKAKNDSFFSEWEFPAIITSAITGLVGVVGVIIIIPSLIGEIVQILVNPPVWILEYIVNLIK